MHAPSSSTAALAPHALNEPLGPAHAPGAAAAAPGARPSFAGERSRAPERRSGAKRALVIGSGFGGLAAAVRLLARGFQVDVLEALPQVGGRARVFRERSAEGEFIFDAGPTVITAPFLLAELWERLGERMADHVELLPVDPFYRIRFADGRSFHYNGDAEQMRAEVERIAPGDVAGYERFVALSRRIYQVGFEQLAHRPFSSFKDMLRIVPAMLRLQSYRTVAGLAARYVKSPELRQVFSFHPLLVGGNPFATTSIYSLILWLERAFGVWFPRGGTGALVEGLKALIERHGGHVYTEHNVARIEVQHGRARGVTLSDGRLLEADLVVSNADAMHTYKRLVPAKARRTWTDRAIARQAQSMGLFVWYFGTRQTFADVAHHTILLGPRYRELLDDIFTSQVLAEDFSLYLHRPTATDPALAPAGCDAFYVLAPVPNLHAEAHAVHWPERAEAYRQKIARFLAATVLPDFERHVCVSRVLTPQHFRDELQSERGAAFGVAPILRQSAYFRPHNHSEDVEGLYLVGAGTHPGAGVPGVLSSARVLETLLEQEGVRAT